MEDMGNPAGNSRLPDVLCVFAPHDNTHCSLCFGYQKEPPKPPEAIVIISAKYFNANTLDINNSIALILLYFGPAAHIDGQKKHPVAQEEIRNLAFIGSQVPGAALIWKFRRSSKVEDHPGATPGMGCNHLNRAEDIHPLKAHPSSLIESFS